MIHSENSNDFFSPDSTFLTHKSHCGIASPCHPLFVPSTSHSSLSKVHSFRRQSECREKVSEMRKCHDLKIPLRWLLGWRIAGRIPSRLLRRFSGLTMICYSRLFGFSSCSSFSLIYLFLIVEVFSKLALFLLLKSTWRADQNRQNRRRKAELRLIQISNGSLFVQQITHNSHQTSGPSPLVPCRQNSYFCQFRKLQLSEIPFSVNKQPNPSSIYFSPAGYLSEFWKHLLSWLRDNIQLSPEGEVNSGGYIPRRKASRYISTALHRPWGR